MTTPTWDHAERLGTVLQEIVNDETESRGMVTSFSAVCEVMDCSAEVWARDTRPNYRCTKASVIVLGSVMGGIPLCRQHYKSAMKRGVWAYMADGGTIYLEMEDFTQKVIEEAK